MTIVNNLILVLFIILCQIYEHIGDCQQLTDIRNDYYRPYSNSGENVQTDIPELNRENRKPNMANNQYVCKDSMGYTCTCNVNGGCMNQINNSPFDNPQLNYLWTLRGLLACNPLNGQCQNVDSYRNKSFPDLHLQYSHNQSVSGSINITNNCVSSTTTKSTTTKKTTTKSTTTKKTTTKSTTTKKTTTKGTTTKKTTTKGTTTKKTTTKKTTTKKPTTAKIRTDSNMSDSYSDISGSTEIRESNFFRKKWKGKKKGCKRNRVSLESYDISLDDRTIEGDRDCAFGRYKHKFYKSVGKLRHVDFKPYKDCDILGIAPDPMNCHYYKEHRIEHEICTVRRFSCPPLLPVYDATKLLCGNYPCVDLPTICRNRNSSKLIALPSFPKIFGKCSHKLHTANRIVFLSSCPKNYTFNEHASNCEPICTSEGVINSVSDCRSYYICKKDNIAFNLVPQRCPNGLVFNVKLQRCEIERDDEDQCSDSS